MYGEQGSNALTTAYCSMAVARERKSKAISETIYRNSLMDTISRNEQGRITSYKYANTDTTYWMTYDHYGDVSSVCSSDGRVWSRVTSDEFAGWMVRTYFERWQVSEKDCGEVLVSEHGLTANGPKADMLGLPERPDRR